MIFQISNVNGILGACLMTWKNHVAKRLNNYAPFNVLQDCSETCHMMYKCAVYGYCISVDRVCDGIPDCLLIDDEENCGKIFFDFFFL